MGEPLRLLLRADGSTQIGTGHVMRCLALAQAALDAGWAVALASAEIPDRLAERLRGEGVAVHRIEASRASALDAERTTALARELGATWVVLDGYLFDPGYQRRVREAARVLVIDDFVHFPHYDADLLLDQNLGAEASAYHARGAPLRVLVGLRYALLRREYARWRSWTRRDPPARPRLLVTLGGSDPGNLTARVIEGTRGVAHRLESVTVVAGAGNPHQAELEGRLRDLGAPAELRRDVPDMSEILADADLAVSAGGSTCWELAFMGLPFVVISIADNQREIARGLHREGVALSVGWHRDCDAPTIGRAMERLVDAPEDRRRMSQQGRALVDGLGAGRVCAALTQAV